MKVILLLLILAPSLHAESTRAIKRPERIEVHDRMKEGFNRYVRWLIFLYTQKTTHKRGSFSIHWTGMFAVLQ
jgi:hypothetical protein